MQSVKKNQIRNQMKFFRAGLSKNEVEEKSNMIFVRLAAANLLSADTYFIYASHGTEVKTDRILEELNDKGKKIYLPKIYGKEMQAVPFDEKSEVSVNKFGILEPVGEPEQLKKFVAIVPCLAVDKNGNRVGYGGGYYDKFLKGKDVTKIAICYDFQVVDKIAAESTDVPMDYIVTEKQLIKISEKQKERT